MNDPRYDALIDHAVSRLDSELESNTPLMAPPVRAWMNTLAGSDAAADYFKHPRAFAFLLVPWLFELALSSEPALGFHQDLAYASVNGYYFIRLFDNIMDDDAVVEKQILPVTAFFYLEINKTFQQYFEPGHPFWAIYERAWLDQSQATVIDQGQSLMSEQQFVERVSLKVGGAKIPLAAVCYFHDRADLLATWSHFLNKLGSWHLMQQDLFDWSKDLNANNMTYFLSAAHRRKSAGESAAAWIVREGLDWGFELLVRWMADIIQLAETLGSDPLLVYLKAREANLLEQGEQMWQGLKLLAALADAQGQAA
jgi:hypothetical protein